MIELEVSNTNIQHMDNLQKMRPPSVIDRYFKKRFKTDVQNKTGEDQLILTHSNRVCVVCIADSHPLIREGKIATKVSFEDKGWNRLDNKFSGKSKRGAQWLDSQAPLCQVTCSDGSLYTLVCCIKGQLIEVNERLLQKPHLITEKPCGEGYLGVLLPGLKWYEREMQKLKSEEEYQSILESRENNLT
ncbi:unnamed protein product [Lymnaea stagnalis]|uniref:Protein Abitram n=1 Tax=Lymnaea stagnalis TaxID=6523 RepID=A0AAV2H4Y0_LYMST